MDACLDYPGKTTILVYPFNFLKKKLLSCLKKVDLFRAERKKEIYQNMANIIEGKKAKAQKEEKKDSSEATEPSEKEEDFSIDVDKVPIPPIPRKFSLVQIFTESPYRLDQEIPAEWSHPESKQEQLRYHVYRDLWNQGFFLSNGSKFGGDFLVYPGDPSRYHSHYIVICIPHDKPMSALDIVRMGRLGSNVRKTVLMCSQDCNQRISYISLQWSGIS